MYRTTLALLFSVSLCLAQDWQWERYQGTFWHQASEDIPWVDFDGSWLFPSGNLVVGDFNGNGRDEILNVMSPILEYSEVGNNGQVLTWVWSWNANSFYDDNLTILYMQSLNLDADAQDELIVYMQLIYEPYTSYVRAYDPTGSVPPSFVERPDLIESLAFPGWPSPSMFGDIEDDGWLDAFTPTNNGCEHYVRDGGSWFLIETLQFNTYTENAYYLAADINSDGDMEVGVYELGIDCNCLFGTIVDFANGQTNIIPMYEEPLLFPGDYDGDGHTESFLDNFELSLPSRLVRLSEGEPFGYTELANQWEANSPVVFSSTASGTNRLYGFYNSERFQMGSWTMVPAGYTMQWNDSSWELTGNGLYYGHVYEGNTADIDDDGDREYIYRMLVEDLFGPDIEIWSIGYGNLSRFWDNPDTLFTNPRLGNIVGDRRGELVTRVAAGAPVGLYFYELELENFHVIAHHQPQFSEGLPTNMTEFTLADIDNDGQTELFINTGFWRSFFWRNNRWEEYSNILPPGIGLNLYFADFDGDGDMDVFSQNGVWISLTPTAADEPVVTPTSFTLSSYPNPFNAQTTIAFNLPRAWNVTLSLYDILGREVQTLLREPLAAGTHTHSFDAAQLPSGVYFARLSSGTATVSHKLLLLK